MGLPDEAPGDLPGEWRRTREYLIRHRHGLTAVADRLYRDLPKVGRLLSRPEWLPAEPLELSELALAWQRPAPQQRVDGTEPAARPLRSGFASYADALGGLAPPAIFENRSSYRLLHADLTAKEMEFAPGSYFDGMNVGESAAHELAAAVMRGTEPYSLPFRRLVGDPRDLRRRTVVPAISTLTIRYDRVGGRASFILHWRDPAKVAHGGGLYQVMPVGIFQPSADSPANETNDFDLWRCMVREFSEELLGESEDHGNGLGALDYDRWPLYRRLASARQAGLLTVHCLGLGVDPLTFAADLLTVAVFDSGTFDEIFARLVGTNAEGRVVGGVPFTEDSIGPFVRGAEPIQAAGSAVLDLAWRNRAGLLR